MKKLLLGLCLTVGVSELSLANTIKNESDNDSNDFMESNKSEIDNTCTIATHYAYYDECGNYLWTFRNSFEASGELCNGNEGGLIINRSRQTLGGCIN